MTRARARRGALAAVVVERGLWGASPFFLLDVGCSGGLAARWGAFGTRLRAVGFDPLVAEIERLRAANSHGGVTFDAAFVTCRQFDELFPPALRGDRVQARNNDPFLRCSAWAAQLRHQVSYVQEQFNAGMPVVTSDKVVVLDEYLAPRQHPEVDFLKVDTDGHDIEVLLGARAIMDAGGILGIAVEVQFHGANHPYANTFANVDTLIRRHGLTLFDLAVHRYSRKALPAPFMYNLAAQTLGGQASSGDALYFRDLGDVDYERMWGYEVTPERVMKLACLFDLFDLPDCAAELLVQRGAFLDPAQRDELLDTLVTGERGSYAAHVASFERDFTAFFPRHRRGLNGTKAEARVHLLEDRVSALRQKNAALGKKNAALRERLKARRDRIAQLTKRLERLERLERR